MAASSEGIDLKVELESGGVNEADPVTSEPPKLYDEYAATTPIQPEEDIARSLEQIVGDDTDDSLQPTPLSTRQAEGTDLSEDELERLVRDDVNDHPMDLTTTVGVSISDADQFERSTDTDQRWISSAQEGDDSEDEFGRLLRHTDSYSDGGESQGDEQDEFTRFVRESGSPSGQERGGGDEFVRFLRESGSPPEDGITEGNPALDPSVVPGEQAVGQEHQFVRFLGDNASTSRADAQGDEFAMFLRGSGLPRDDVGDGDWSEENETERTPGEPPRNDGDSNTDAAATDNESKKSEEDESVKQLLLLKAINSRYLPAFANEENVILNDLVLEAELALKKAEEAVEEQDDRASIMEEHMKRVQEEIYFAQSRHEAKRREIATEEHLLKMSNFEIGRLKAEMTKMAKEGEDIANRLRAFRTAIFQANEKMDQFRLLMHWNQEELEQWTQAAKQKEEDNVAMERYRKSDDVRISELQLEEVKAATELSNLRAALDAEVTETQSCQIQLDKTAILFRELHIQRQKVIALWETTVEAIHERDESIHQVAEEFGDNKVRVQKKKHQLDALQKALFKELDTNKDLERMIIDAEHEVVKARDICRKEVEEARKADEGHELMKINHMRAQGELAVQTALKAQSEEDIEVKKKKVIEAKKRHELALKKVKEENDHLDTLEKRAHELGRLMTEEENKVKRARKEVAQLHEMHFKATEELHALRDAEKETLHQISGGKSQIRTLGHNATHLEMQMTRQEEVLYTLDFQIQSLERKVGRAMGERSDVEEKETSKKIAELERQLQEKKNEEALVISQLKRTQEELRATVRKNEDVQERVKDITQKNAELSLECDTGLIEVKASQKEKEEKMLDHDLLQMEVNRLSDILNMKADGVFTMETIKQKLIMCMEDHKREINSRRERTKAQLKIIQDELHNLMIQRKKLALKIEKLQAKFETLIARVKMEDGTERSANYYIIKAAQERQLLELEVPKLEEEVENVKRDVQQLQKATDEIQESNNALRTSFNTPKSIELAHEQKLLKQVYQEAKERTRFKQREEAALLQEVKDAERRLENAERERQTVTETIRDLQKKVEIAKKDADEQSAKHRRATLQLQKISKEIKEKLEAVDIKRIEKELQLVEVRETMKDVLYKLKGLAMEDAEASGVIQAKVAEAGLKLPSGVSSARSSRSGSSTSSSASSLSSQRRGPSSSSTTTRKPLAGSIVTMDLNLDDL